MAKTDVKIQFTFTLPIDESLLQHKTDAERKAKEVFVLELLRYGDISAGRAAKLLNISRWDLSELMSAAGISPFAELTTAALDTEVETALKVLSDQVDEDCHNSTPLIELSKIKQLDLLQKVYGTICIPDEVYIEVVVEGTGKPGAAEVNAAEWIYRQSVKNKSQVRILQSQRSLHLGECATIVLAQEMDADQVILDDNAARQEAIARQLPVIGTVGVLLVAKIQRIIPAVKPILDDLRAQGTRVSQDLYSQVIARADE